MTFLYVVRAPLSTCFFIRSPLFSLENFIDWARPEDCSLHSDQRARVCKA